MDRITCMDAFVRVVDAGSFAEAARRWGRSKAVVSKYVGQLEDHLGLRLLQRTTRSLGLTDAGRSHYERSQQILALLAESEAQLREDHVAPRGLLRVTAPPGFLSLHRQSMVSGFVRRYPDVVLELDLTHRMVDVVEERIDVALRLTRPDDSTLVARRLAPAPLVLVAAPSYLAGAQPLGRVADLARHPCVVDTNMRWQHRWPLWDDGQERVVEVRGPVRANSPVLVRGAAVDGLGVAMVPRMLVDGFLADGRLVEVLPGAVRAAWSVWALTSERRHLPARARVFIEHVRTCLRSPG